MHLHLVHRTHFNCLVVLSPNPTSSLLRLHLPDSWIPHCTVAKEVPRSRIGEAFGILRDLKLPISGYAMDIGLVEFSPVVRELLSFPLGDALED
ncbi:hypothetical protein MKX01_008432 [Papaver californicum]|nr:hypothetical protein MKX01_008432 [Papaver californicum]